MLFPKWNVASWEKEQLEGKTFLNLNKLHSISFFFLWNEKSFYVFCVRNWKSQLQRVWEWKISFSFPFWCWFSMKINSVYTFTHFGVCFLGFFFVESCELSHQIVCSPNWNHKSHWKCQNSSRKVSSLSFFSFQAKVF